jgi:hypothetical protein
MAMDENTRSAHRRVREPTVITGKTRRDLTEKARHVPELVESLVDQPALSPRSARRVTEILDRVESELTALRVQSTGEEVDLTASPDVVRHYFSVRETPRREVSPSEVAETQARWEKLAARGRGYREEALREIGPLWDRDQVARHLGVSIPTLHSRRKRGELLAVTFDNYRYWYPAWQFVSSPTEGETGVVRNFSEILRLLGDLPSWEKARFFVTESPALGGRRPIDVLRRGTSAQIETLRALAPRVGEPGL